METKYNMDMHEILAAFASEPLFSASEKFLKYLGVKTSTQTADPIPFLEMYEDAAKDAGAEVPKPIKNLFGRVEETCFIGSVDDDTLRGGKEGVSFQIECQNQKYEGMFVFAVRMKDGEELTRTDAALLTRGINRLVHQQPAIVLILEDTLLSVATCERTPYKQTWRPGEKLGKVSILKGVNCLNPHRGHIDILESMNVKKAKTFDALYEQWQKVFSTSILTNNFYNELFDWYMWTTSPKSAISFPEALTADGHLIEPLEMKVIRLLTRTMFVWFVKQKGLIPACLFDKEYLKRIVLDFDPESRESGNYYNAILQNLFFATLNRAIEDEDGKRRFASAQNQVDSKNLYRYEELFAVGKDEVVALFSQVPFVNGSLFECLDKTKTNDGVEKVYHDGFSRNANRDANGRYRHRATIPNEYFFHPNKGLFSLFERYNFTIEENTPLDQAVALDPELLGKVFENLLGAYNEETQQSARKQSGSFYTPRQIVEYKIDQALIRYLGDTAVVREIFSDDFQYNDAMVSEYEAISKKLLAVKIIDIACGSGAFPVGALNRMVEILKRLRVRESTYALKRYIIEHCLYGSDIQCIATQITRLRFFISLIVDCEVDPSKANFGIPALPNLETKFVAADSLVAVRHIGSLPCNNSEVCALRDELQKVRHEHFNAQTANAKRRLIGKDVQLRQKLLDLLVGKMYSGEDARRLAFWNPYCQNVAADYFDPEWMFGVSGGFDIVIGNPPHGAKIAPAVQFQDYKLMCGETAILFIEKGAGLLRPNGILSYVLPKPFCYASNYVKTREFVWEGIQELIDCGKMFDKVKFEECVLIYQPSLPTSRYKSFVFSKESGLADYGFVDKALSDEFGLLLNGVTTDQVDLAIRLKRSCKALGTYIDNTRGGQVQSLTGSDGDAVVLGGRGIARHGLRPGRENGRMNESDIQQDNWRCHEGSVLVQNIVAHIMNPVPHVKITACFSPGSGYVIADTVNQFDITDPLLAKEVLWAVLNSRLINWYAYKFVFGNAIRTMHFDAVSTDKIPMLDLNNPLVTDLVSLARKVAAESEIDDDDNFLVRSLDRLVCRAYGLSDTESDWVMAMPT